MTSSPDPQQASHSSEAAAVEHAGDGRNRRGRYARLLRRFAMASALATVLSQLVFLGAYTLGGAPVTATVLAWLAGAVPNFLLNRRTWGSRGRSALRGEIARFAVISVTTAILAALATRRAEVVALEVFAGQPSARVALVWGAFLGTYAVMFVVKFLLMDRLVFSASRRNEPAG